MWGLDLEMAAAPRGVGWEKWQRPGLPQCHLGTWPPGSVYEGPPPHRGKVRWYTGQLPPRSTPWAGMPNGLAVRSPPGQARPGLGTPSRVWHGRGLV